MDIYYLTRNAFKGPVSAERINHLFTKGDLKEDSPIWVPPSDNWIACSSVLQNTNASRSENKLPHDTTQEIITRLDRRDLPSPKNLLALKLARKQEFITPDQTNRMARELMSIPDKSFTMPDRLLEKGWITSLQKSFLESAANQGKMTRLLGNYEILEELGRGGMGSTYKARQISMDRIVALKILARELCKDTEYVQRFEREARMAAKLNHENVATAFEVGCVGDKYFLSMEYVEGATLDQLLSRKERFSEQEALRIVKRIARALSHAHQHNMVHRDISTRNVIIKPDGTPKLIDMGLAKTISSEKSDLSTIGVIKGTPSYMSPEMALARESIDIRTDIYSLGCVLYELLAGQPPFQGKSAVEVINMHVNNPIPAIKKSRPDLSNNTVNILKKMTAKKPENRFQTPDELIRALSNSSESARISASLKDDLPPVTEQIASWDGSPTEVFLRVDWREYTHVIERELDNLLEKEDAEPEFRGYANTLFAELVANAFDHGCKGLSEGTVTIRMELNDVFFKLEVEDPGPGFPAQETMKKIKTESVQRERRRGIIQVMRIADDLTYSPEGNHVKAVLYRKSKGSGVFVSVSDNITNVEIRGKCDFALTESFKKWVEEYSSPASERICLMVRTDWVSSQFVGAIVHLNQKAKQNGSAFSVWTEHKSCFRIMQQLGLTTYVHIYDSLETARMSLRLADVESGIFPNPLKTMKSEPERPKPEPDKPEIDKETKQPPGKKGFFSSLFSIFRRKNRK